MRALQQICALLDYSDNGCLLGEMPEVLQCRGVLDWSK